MAKPSGIPGVSADDSGNLQVDIGAEAPTDIPTGIPGITGITTASGKLRVTVDSVDAVKLQTGIPGVFSDSAKRLRVTEAGSNVAPTGIPGVFSDGSGNLRVTKTGALTTPTGIPNVFSDAGRLRVVGIP